MSSNLQSNLENVLKRKSKSKKIPSKLIPNSIVTLIIFLMNSNLDLLNSSQRTKKIRDLNRILTSSSLGKINLTAAQEDDIKRKIKFISVKKSDNKEDLYISKLKTKYKYVKFVELTKVNRLIKKYKEELLKTDSSNDSFKIISKKLEEMKINKLYITHYPIDMKYISIFTTSTDTNDKSSETKEKIKQTILNSIDSLTNTAGFVLKKQNVYQEKQKTNETKITKDEFFE